MNVIAMSKKMEEYFVSLDKEVNHSYKIANKAKKNSFDPDNFVDIPLAQNMMERVVGLISILTPQIRNKGVEQRIQDLEKQILLSYFKTLPNISVGDIDNDKEQEYVVSSGGGQDSLVSFFEHNDTF